MGDTIVKLYQRQNYVINEDILKAIKKNNLSLDEALLIIYFCSMNNHAMLDVEEINKKFGINDIETMKAFASITEKHLINIKMEKNKENKMEEIIDLTPLYESIAIEYDSESRGKNTVKVYETFEGEFGRPLSSMEIDIINRWLDKGISEDLINSALKEATFNGTLTLRYIDAIIAEWNRKGFKTGSDVELYLKKRKPSKIKKNSDDLFDYDWLDDSDD